MRRWMKKFSIKKLLKVESLEKYYNALANNPDLVLSVKYRATYSLNNPRLDNKNQTYDKVFYTNKDQTKFIKEETAGKY